MALFEERGARLEAENGLLRARFLRDPGRRRPHYRRNERMDILWHAARYRLSVHQTAHTFALSAQTVVNWHRVMRRKEPRLSPPLHALPDLAHELVHRLKVEWPRWGARRSGAPRWLVTDKDPVLRGGLVQRSLTRQGILRRRRAEGVHSVDRADLENVEVGVRATPLPSSPDSRTGDEAAKMGSMAQRTSSSSKPEATHT